MLVKGLVMNLYKVLQQQGHHGQGTATQHQAQQPQRGTKKKYQPKLYYNNPFKVGII